MLRPTESKVVWLQQLGRGLRKANGKPHLVAIDYIGNHRVFLNKPEALFQALGLALETKRDVITAMRAKEFEALLPPGCEITYELQSIEVLEKLLPPSLGADRVKQWYQEFREFNGRRPTALEAYQSSFNPRALKREYKTWFAFVRAMGDLEPDEARVADADSALMHLVETTSLTRSYKLLVLRAMLMHGALPGKLGLVNLASAFAIIAKRSARLRADISIDLDDPRAVQRLLVAYPCERLAAERTAAGVPLFQLSDDTFGTTSQVRSDGTSSLPELIAELVDWRLAEYLDRPQGSPVFRVIQNSSGNPIVKIDRKRYELPSGWTPVMIRDRPYELNFVKEFVNVAREPGSEQNILPNLLRGWFGAEAGAPGGRFEVVHVQTPDGSYKWQPNNALGGRAVGEGLQLYGDDGEPVDARFKLEHGADATSIVFMSRGAGRNDQYNRGLELLLSRLGARGARIESVQLETDATRQIAAEKRALAVEGFAYPIDLAGGADVVELRKSIGRAAAALGRKPGARGAGNATKRLRIILALPDGADLDESYLQGRSS